MKKWQKAGRLYSLIWTALLLAIGSSGLAFFLVVWKNDPQESWLRFGVGMALLWLIGGEVIWLIASNWGKPNGNRDQE